MDLHRRIGGIFVAFCAVAICLNILSPTNPDLLTNLLELSVIMLIFAMTVTMQERFGGGIQIAGLTVCAALAPNSPGGPFFSAFIVVFCLVLFYAYGGYKTQRGVKVAASAVVVYGVMIFTLAKYDQPIVELFVRGVSWSAFIYVFSWVLWVVAEDMDRKFHTIREQELLTINRELIDLNRALLEEQHHAT